MRTPLHASQALPRFRAPSVNTCCWPSSPLSLTVTCILTSTPRAQSKPHLAASPHPQDPSTLRALHTDTCWPVSHHQAHAWSETDVKRSPNPAYCSEDSPILLVTVASLPQHRSGRHSRGCCTPSQPSCHLLQAVSSQVHPPHRQDQSHDPPAGVADSGPRPMAVSQPVLTGHEQRGPWSNCPTKTLVPGSS